MASDGEVNLDVLIGSMRPELHDCVYVFATVSAEFDYSALHPVMVFQEQEGTTLIVEAAIAKKHNVSAEFPCKMITLNIHSSLDAVGFLAHVTTHLAKFDMGVNPVSGFYHDHLFVPENRAIDALNALIKLSNTTTT